MRKALTIIMLAILCLSAFSGCGSLGGYTVTKRDAIDKQIAMARADTETKMTALKGQEVKVLNDIITQHVLREQSAANFLFKGTVVWGGLNPNQVSRPTLVMGQSIEQTSAQLPAASPEIQASTFKALQTELDEAKISTAALKAQYDLEMGKARAEGEAKTKALADLDGKLKTIETDRTAVMTNARATEIELAAKKDEIQNKAQAATQKKLDDAKHSEHVKMWLIGIFLLGATACGLGAAFLPIPTLKSKLILGAAICGGAAIAIPFIEGWMVMVGVGILLIPVVAWVLKNYHDEHADATDTYRAINELRTKSGAEFNTLVAPVLKEWHTNPFTTKRIDATLKKMGDT